MAITQVAQAGSETEVDTETRTNLIDDLTSESLDTISYLNYRVQACKNCAKLNNVVARANTELEEITNLLRSAMRAMSRQGPTDSVFSSFIEVDSQLDTLVDYLDLNLCL